MKSVNDDICSELWHQYELQLRKICNIKLQSCPSEIDDVISEVFLALCKKVNSDGVPDNPKAWLYATLRNIINSKYREVNKHKKLKSKLANKEFELPYTYSFENDILDSFLAEKIINTLESEFSELDNLIIKYVCEDKLKMKEVAELLNMSEPAVKQRYYRLCKKVRKIANRNNF